MTFTDSYIRGLKPAARTYKRSEGAPKGEGRLVVRVLPSGAKEFFYRYRAGGRDTLLAIGRYDPTGKSGKTLALVREELAALRGEQRQTGDVKGHRANEERKVEIERRRGTLTQLMDAYLQRLNGRPSWRDARGAFQRNVVKPFPSLAATKAADVLPADIQRILARMVKLGITRHVNITRAYLHAAFAFGQQTDHDPRTAASDGVLFGLRANPVSAVPKIGEFDSVRDRVLSEAELRDYWHGLDRLPVEQRATLRFNLALACQRPTQLIRCDWAAFNLETERTLLLRDGKGRGGCRDHLIPLTAFALQQLEPLRTLNANAATPFTSGTNALAVDVLSRAVSEVSTALVEASGAAPFQQRDLRRTAETMLQKLGVDKEVRAHLLSHGRTAGVQGKHYERYDFLQEKRQALERWGAYLQRVVPIKAAATQL